MADKTKKGSTGSKGKVVRVIDEYDLEGVGDELEAHWTADDDRMSLRELAVYFNKEILRADLQNHGVDLLSGEVENFYELLTDDDTTSGERIEVKNRLRNYGIDSEQLKQDFVSRQSIDTYLKKHRNVEYTENQQDEQTIIDRRLEELQRLMNRLSSVTERTFDSLDSSDYISVGEFQVLVSLQIQCTDCNTQFEVAELLRQRRCECTKDTNDE